MSEGAYEDDIRSRMSADMTKTMVQHGFSADDIEAVVDCLVDDGMHQVYKAWEEGRP